MSKADNLRSQILALVKEYHAAILFGTQFALIEGSYRKVREKATVIGSVGYAGWQQFLVKVTDGKRGG